LIRQSWLALAVLAGCAPPAPPPSPPPLVKEAQPPKPEMARGLTSRTIVLTYHDMVPERNSESLWFDCTPEELQEQVDWLQDQGAVFISLDELRQGLTGEASLPKGAVAITFADNYRGFLEHAWPILSAEKIPVTMFVHTGHVGGETGRPKMTWGELKSLSESPLFSAQSQTVSHPADLTQLGPEDLRREFVDSREALEENLGRPVTMLAYPNGKFSNQAAELADEAGYVLAFTEELALAESAPNLRLIPRWVHTRYEDAWRAANPD
jgi:peptidoglycan/xylan/chitin deacetylase (PgdA/CDA1 family)